MHFSQLHLLLAAAPVGHATMATKLAAPEPLYETLSLPPLPPGYIEEKLALFAELRRRLEAGVVFDFDGSPNRPHSTFAASRRDFQTLAESFRVSLGFLWKIGLQIQERKWRRLWTCGGGFG